MNLPNVMQNLTSLLSEPTRVSVFFEEIML